MVVTSCLARRLPPARTRPPCSSSGDWGSRCVHLPLISYMYKYIVFISKPTCDLPWSVSASVSRQWCFSQAVCCVLWCVVGACVASLPPSPPPGLRPRGLLRHHRYPPQSRHRSRHRSRRTQRGLERHGLGCLKEKGACHACPPSIGSPLSLSVSLTTRREPP